MTKAEIISFYKNSVLKPDKTSRYHDRVIEYAVSMAYEQILHDTYLKDPVNVDEYVVTKTGLVAHDGTRDYIDVPASYIKLPGKASGVRGVRTTGHAFFPMTLMEYEQASDFDIWEAGTAIGYAVGQDKIYLHNLPSDWQYVSDNIDIDIVQSFEEYALTDEVTMPYGQSAKMMELVLNYLRVIPPEQLLNNNADNG